MFCSKCGTQNDDAAKFCQKCGAALTVGAPPPPQPQPAAGGETRRGDVPVASAPGKRYARDKNAVLAAVLSLIICGVGQFYNGDIKKGAVMFAGFLLLFVPTGGIASLAIGIWSIIDAYRVASGKAPLW
jgi:TM2 domain-containing membrane protein YozV